MHVVLIDLIKDSEETYMGDPALVERQIREKHPWLGEHIDHGELDELLDYIASQQTYDIEVVDDTAHPFLAQE